MDGLCTRLQVPHARVECRGPVRGLGRELEASVAKAARYYATLGYGSFAA